MLSINFDDKANSRLACHHTAGIQLPLNAGVKRLLGVVWLSDKAYTVDALAVRGDEGRVSLRKAVVSRQNAFEPQMSEWGNPPVYRYRYMNT